MNQEDKHLSFAAAVSQYRSFPIIAAVLLVAVFLVVSFWTNNNYLAAIAAAVPSSLLMWRWVRAGREVDRWQCSKCGQPVKGAEKMPWTYPPDNCPRCGNPYT